MIVVPQHARKQMLKRGISESDVKEAIEYGTIIIEEVNHRFGLKKFSRLTGLLSDLIVIWRYNKKDEKEVITAYWRGKKA